MKFTLNLPLNNVSFGQVSLALCRDIFERGLMPSIFPIGGVDISSQQISPEFGAWLQDCINKSTTEHKRSIPCFRLWHLDGSLFSVSDKTILMSFLESDAPTQAEINCVRNQAKTIFTNRYSTSLFTDLGCKNVITVPLGFDKDNFIIPDQNAHVLQDRITFNLVGKLENRKRHVQCIKAWIAAFGDNSDYALNCAVWNPFLKQEIQNQILSQAVGRAYKNVQFLPFMPTNAQYARFLASGDIVLAMSASEGWGLPEFHSVAMGKHAVVLDAHAFKDWANVENSCLVSPCGKSEIYDGIHFFKNPSPQAFNQGRVFDWNDKDFVDGCEKAIERVKKDRVNHEGLKLQEKFTYKKTVDKILKELELLQ